MIKRRKRNILENIYVLLLFAGHKRARIDCCRFMHTVFYWASGWAGCWKAGHSIAVSRLHNVALKCVQVCNRGWIRVPELESQRETAQTPQRESWSHLAKPKSFYQVGGKSSAVIGWLGMKVQTRGGELGVEGMWLKWSEIKSEISICESDIHSMETHRGYFVQRAFLIYPGLPINAKHLHFLRCFHS